MWDTAKAVLRRKFIAQMYTLERQEESSQINNPSSYFKNLKKKVQNKLKTSKGMEIIKATLEINEIKNNSKKIKTMKQRAGSLKRL